jgi:hypothetical protein
MDSQVNYEAIVLLSSEVQYFEELETAAKIKKYIKQKNVSQLPESIQILYANARHRHGRLKITLKSRLKRHY